MDLQTLRGEIDHIDSQLITLLARRMEIVEQIAEYKYERGLPVLNRDREAVVIAQVRERAGTDLADDTQAFFEHLMRLSRERQEALILRKREQAI